MTYLSEAVWAMSFAYGVGQKWLPAKFEFPRILPAPKLQETPQEPRIPKLQGWNLSPSSLVLQVRWPNHHQSCWLLTVPNSYRCIVPRFVGSLSIVIKTYQNYLNLSPVLLVTCSN